MKKSAYLDNNIFIDIEQSSLSMDDLRNNVDPNLSAFYYSDFHLMEANEMTSPTEKGLNILLNKRFATISSVTNNNYLDEESPYKVYTAKIEPSILFEKINNVLDSGERIKQVLNSISEEQKEDFRRRMEIDPMRMNNFSAKEVIDHVNKRSESLDGLSIIERIENDLRKQSDGKEIGMGNRFAGLFEFLDLIGYWKDKYNSKSNYARLWDSGHSFLSSYCDYFISNDRRTRNKAKVAFEIYGAKTIVIAPDGTQKN